MHYTRAGGVRARFGAVKAGPVCYTCAVTLEQGTHGRSHRHQPADQALRQGAGIESLDLSVISGRVRLHRPQRRRQSTLIRTLLGLTRPSGGGARALGLPLAQAEYSAGSATCQARSPTTPHAGEGRLPHERAAARQGLREESWVLCDRLSLDQPLRTTCPSTRRSCISSRCSNARAADTGRAHQRPDPCTRLLGRDQPAQRAGATIFLSSHVLSEVQHHCRHAAIIRRQADRHDTVENLARSAAKRVTLRGSGAAARPVGAAGRGGRAARQRAELAGDVHQLTAALPALQRPDHR